MIEELRFRLPAAEDAAEAEKQAGTEAPKAAEAAENA